MDRVPNTELFERSGVPCVSELLSCCRVRWGGHLARCGDDRWAKQLLFTHVVPGGTRPVGRPHTAWAGMLQADLAARQPILGGQDWYSVAQDRAAWRIVAKG